MGKELSVVLQDKQDVGTQRAVQQEAGPPRPAPGDHLRDLDGRGGGFWGEEGRLEEGLLDLIQGRAEGTISLTMLSKNLSFFGFWVKLS